jgi:hypothetical protein
MDASAGSVRQRTLARQDYGTISEAYCLQWSSSVPLCAMTPMRSLTSIYLLGVDIVSFSPAQMNPALHTGTFLPLTLHANVLGQYACLSSGASDALCTRFF